jgi:hypothetical protein
MRSPIRSAAALAGLTIVIAACSSAASPSPSEEASVSPSAPASVAISASPEPTLVPTPTATPAPTAIAPQSLTVQLSMTTQRGLIEGPGRCDIGLNETSLYLEHRTASALDAYITLGPSAGGMSGPGIPPGGGTYGPEVLQIFVVDASVGSFLKATNPQMIVAAGLKSGSFTGTWKGEPLTGEFTCS